LHFFRRDVCKAPADAVARCCLLQFFRGLSEPHRWSHAHSRQQYFRPSCPSAVLRGPCASRSIFLPHAGFWQKRSGSRMCCALHCQEQQTLPAATSDGVTSNGLPHDLFWHTNVIRFLCAR
jgi:hypothetical protein